MSTKPAAGPWISVKERLPEKDKPVLTYSSDGPRYGHWTLVPRWKNAQFLAEDRVSWQSDCMDSCGCCDSWNEEITHWAEINEPEEKE